MNGTVADLSKATRVVIKIGTNTLTGPGGHPDLWFMNAIADDVAALRREGRDVLVVTSGAIGAGVSALNFTERPREVRLRQAAAAVGQSRLMHAWDLAFSRHGLTVAQLLLTYDAFSDREQYLNLRNATEALLELGAVPVVNENDTVSVDEIEDRAGRPDYAHTETSFGDNDALSALVAGKVEAHALLILSDVAGLYTHPPGHPKAELVPEVVGEVTPEVEAMAGAKPGSQGGRGGMRSKLNAARIAMDAGVTVVIADGREPHALTRILHGEPLGTRFIPKGRDQGREWWLANAQPQGRILVDAGAAAALHAHKHLLPAGVTGVHGVFDAESVVDIVHGDTVVARAISAYASHELDAVKGLHSDEIKGKFSWKGSVNVTRKGGIVLLEG